MQNASPPPPVAVVYDLGSASPLDVLRAARGTCRPILVYNRDDAHCAAISDMLSSLKGLDATGLSSDQVAAELTELGVRGILTFSEYQITRTADLATRLGLPYQDPDTTRRLVDKHAQRAALAAAGVDSTRQALLERPEDTAAALAAVGLPAVLKPTVGGASRNAFPVHEAAECHELVSRLLGDGEETSLVLEEMLVGRPLDPWGDYVSVESVTESGTSAHVGITGKFRLCEPFRESGMFAPAELAPSLRAQVLELTDRALAAIGFRHGVTHTEIKLTADGPRLIEVNGRLGGHVGDLTRRSGGPDMVRLALLAALGVSVEAEPIDHPSVAFQYFVLAPIGAHTLSGIDGLDQIRTLPGVTTVDVDPTPREIPDWRLGPLSRLGVVYGRVDNHAQLGFLKQLLDETIRVETEVTTTNAPSGEVIR